MAGAFHVIVAPRYSPTGIGSHDPPPPTRGEMTTRTTPVTDTSADAAPGVQLVQPDVASATQPGLFDHLPDSALTVHHRTLVDARPGDRMLLCLGLDVSASAVKVATALAFHGWSSWPSRETLASQTNLHPNHVSRACKELEDAGIVSRRRRYHKGGNVGIQYTFRGDALVAATAGQNHPTLGPSISALAAGRSANTDLVSAPVSDEDSRRAANTNLVSAGDGQSPDAGANTDLVSAPVSDEDSRRAANTNLVSAGDGQSPDAGANTNLVSAEVQDEDSRRAANTNLVSAQLGPTTREYQFGIGANTNLVPEPEVTEPERMILTDEINQSNSSSSGSGDARAKNESPPWYRELAAALDPGRVPDLQAIEEQAFLAGWSDAVLQSAARIYLRNYRNQRVTDPLALFRKLAIQEASRLPPPEPQRRGKYSEDHRRRKSQDT